MARAPFTPSLRFHPRRYAKAHPARLSLLQAGLVQFPDCALLNIVYASLQAVLLNEPSVR